MHIIILKFTKKRHSAEQYLPDHKAWLERGFEDDAFLLAGTLGSNLGGAILARGLPIEAIQERVNEDPFVRENIVSAEVLEYAPSVAGEELRFLLHRRSADA